MGSSVLVLISYCLLTSGIRSDKVHVNRYSNRYKFVSVLKVSFRHYALHFWTSKYVEWNSQLMYKGYCNIISVWTKSAKVHCVLGILGADVALFLLSQTEKRETPSVHSCAWHCLVYNGISMAFFVLETSNCKWINPVHYIIGVLFACSEIPLLSIHTSMCIYTPRLEVCTIHGPSNRFGKEGMKKLTIFVHMINIIFLRMCISRIFDIIMLI